MTINNKSERNYRGKCLGWPVTSYGGAADACFVQSVKHDKLDSTLWCENVRRTHIISLVF